MIRTRITVNYTDTHKNWADSFYHSGNTGKSHNPYIWHLFSALSVFLCNIKKQNKKQTKTFLVVTLTGIIECIVNTHFFETRGTSACTVSRSASCLINSVVKSSCPYLSGLCSCGICACFFLKFSNKINEFTHAISRKWQKRVFHHLFVLREVLTVCLSTDHFCLPLPCMHYNLSQVLVA